MRTAEKGEEMMMKTRLQIQDDRYSVRTAEKGEEMMMKTQISRELVWSLLGGLGLLILSAGFVSASDGTASTDAAVKTARQVSVTLNAGETYVIKGLSQGDTPAVRVRENPNALRIPTHSSCAVKYRVNSRCTPLPRASGRLM